MGIDELESRVKRLYEDVKSGKITKEIAEDATGAIHDIEDLGMEAKEKFEDMVHEMKDGIKKFREKL